MSIIIRGLSAGCAAPQDERLTGFQVAEVLDLETFAHSQYCCSSRGKKSVFHRLSFKVSHFLYALDDFVYLSNWKFISLCSFIKKDCYMCFNGVLPVSIKLLMGDSIRNLM